MPNPIRDFAGAIDALDIARRAVASAERGLQQEKAAFETAKANAAKFYFEAYQAALAIGVDLPGQVVIDDQLISIDEEGFVAIERHTATGMQGLLEVADALDRTPTPTELERSPCNS